MGGSMNRIAALIMAATVAASAGPAQAQTPSEVNDLVGARAAGAETALQARGYVFIRVQDGDDRKYTYWWNVSRRQCLTVATMDGRYASITSTPAPDCDQRERGNAVFDRRADDPANRDRPQESRYDGGGYRPDVGYRQDAPPVRQEPSYAGGRRDTGEAGIRVGGYNVDLGLVCFGDGQRPGLATTYGWSWNSRRDRYDYGNRTELTAQQFDASVMVQLWNGGGRISLPKKLIPPINSRGRDGWWELYDVDAGPDVIHAKYRLNGLNKPSITINRRSGQITILGTSPYAFKGGCDLVDSTDKRRF